MRCATSGEQVVEIENRAHLAPDLGERFERVRVLALRLEQPRIDDRLRDVRAKLAQNRFVALGKRVLPIGQQVERTEDLALVPQRYDEVRLRTRHHGDVAGIGGNVVDENRPLLGHCGADEPFTDSQGELAGGVLWISDGIRDPQLAAPFVEQVDGKHAEGGDPRDELRDLLEQLVDFEDGRDLSPKIEKRGQQLGVGHRAADVRTGRGIRHWVVVFRVSPSVWRVTHS